MNLFFSIWSYWLQARWELTLRFCGLIFSEVHLSWRSALFCWAASWGCDKEGIYEVHWSHWLFWGLSPASEDFGSTSSIKYNLNLEENSINNFRWTLFSEKQKQSSEDHYSNFSWYLCRNITIYTITKNYKLSKGFFREMACSWPYFLLACVEEVLLVLTCELYLSFPWVALRHFLL